MRQFFKTVKVHSCYSQDSFEDNWNGFPVETKIESLDKLRPKKCRCKWWVSTQVATQLVADGVASWEIKFEGGFQTYGNDIVLSGRAGKTPRAQTIEKAHMERYTERLYHTQVFYGDDNSEEVMERDDIYHDIEIEARIKFFHMVGQDLWLVKKYSDMQGDLTGEEGRNLSNYIVQQADEMKFGVAKEDQFVGRAIFNSLGYDQRTDYSKMPKKRT